MAKDKPGFDSQSLVKKILNVLANKQEWGNKVSIYEGNTTFMPSHITVIANLNSKNKWLTKTTEALQKLAELNEAKFKYKFIPLSSKTAFADSSKSTLAAFEMCGALRYKKKIHTIKDLPEDACLTIFKFIDNKSILIFLRASKSFSSNSREK
jgi:hypothetical protein